MNWRYVVVIVVVLHLITTVFCLDDVEEELATADEFRDEIPGILERDQVIPGIQEPDPRTTPTYQRRHYAKKPSPFHLHHLRTTGERISELHAHTFNSHPAVAEMQRDAAPNVRFKRKNFGLRQVVTDLVNLTFAVNQKRVGHVLLGLFGETVPRATAAFLRLINNGALVGSRCVRMAPRYAAQCGDLGPRTDFSLSQLRSAPVCAVERPGTVKVLETHAPGTISLVAPEGYSGSHFVLSATSERELNSSRVSNLTSFGQILSGFAMFSDFVLQYVPVDADTMAPRGLAVEIQRAWTRPFPRNGLMDVEQRSVSDRSAFQTERSEAHLQCEDKNATVFLISVPAHVQERYFTPPKPKARRRNGR